MSDVLIKVCGITNVDDAVKCAELGVDLIGLQIYKGAQRFIRPAMAQAIIDAVAPQADVLQTVGVVKNPSEQELEQLLEDVAFDLLQYDGAEPPEFCHNYDIPFIKRFAPVSTEDVEAMADYAGRWHLVDWNLADAQPHWASKNAPEGTLMISSAATPENVVDLIQRFSPGAVDILGGVEKSPGRKDHARLQALIRAVRAA